MTFVVFKEKIYLSPREGFVAVLVFLSASVLIFLDILEDGLDGVPLGHLATEFLLFTFSLSGIFYVYFKTTSKMHFENMKLAYDLSKLCEDFASWKERTKGIYRALSEEISKQYASWGLSEAEIDIANLLLKGLSHKEIAELRKSSEQTVRQQAASIYEKSKLEGRAQFSAFFLEGLVEVVEDKKER